MRGFMKLWKNLKWLCWRDVGTDYTHVLEKLIDQHRTMMNIQRRVDGELSRIGQDVATAMNIATHCEPSVADILKENRTEHYTVRAIRLLNQNGIHTARQLYGMSEKDLRRIKGLGRNTADYIMTTLFEQRDKYDR